TCLKKLRNRQELRRHSKTHCSSSKIVISDSIPNSPPAFLIPPSSGSILLPQVMPTSSKSISSDAENYYIIPPNNIFDEELLPYQKRLEKLAKSINSSHDNVFFTGTTIKFFWQ
ncbi:hypothetical protein HK099_006900, partial [Clydaea vesicula]